MKIYYYSCSDADSDFLYFTTKKDCQRSMGFAMLRGAKVGKMLSIVVTYPIALSFLVSKLNRAGSDNLMVDLLTKIENNQKFV